MKWKPIFQKFRNNAFGGTSIAAVFAQNYAKTIVEDDESMLEGDEGTVINIKTIQNEMKYDLSEFEVTAGSTVT